MAKSAKAKKAKKADFQKVKLKVGKKLKKAQNETKTEFKARKIILKEQLTVKATKTLVTKKQHDITELLSRLNYHNVYVRQDGINGLRELVNRYEPSLLLPHLSTFILRGAPAILDSDPLIRTSATKFLEAIIIKMGPSIEPYFRILATHLSCAMVHLNVGVQGDSLQLIKVLIKHTPKLIAHHANTVLNNFLSLIARKAKSSKQESKTGTPKPIVTFNFSGLLQPKVKNPLAGHAGRLSLLVELSNFLEAVLVEHGRMQKEIPHTTWDTVIMGSVPPLTCDDSDKADELWLFTDIEKLEEFTNTVLRLLMQLWLEVDEGNFEDSSAGGNALNEEGVETLSCIVNIIMHIWRITQICTQEHPRKCRWLKAHFSSDFMKRIMNGFPFCCQVSAVKSKKRKKDKEAQGHEDEAEKQKLKHCDDLNVLLSLFGTQMSLKFHQSKAVNFLSQLLRDGNRDGQYNMTAVVKIIKELMAPAQKSEIQTIVSASHICFVRLHPLKKDRALLLDLLLEVLGKDHQYMWSYTSVTQWIEQIVKDLVGGDVRERELHVAISLRLRNNTDIRALLLSEKEKILDAVRKKGIQGLTSEELEKKLKSLLKE